ncbi:hypothetical protein ACJX0J_015890, partial [Zea mays]
SFRKKGQEAKLISELGPLLNVSLSAFAFLFSELVQLIDYFLPCPFVYFALIDMGICGSEGKSFFFIILMKYGLFTLLHDPTCIMPELVRWIMQKIRRGYCDRWIMQKIRRGPFIQDVVYFVGGPFVTYQSFTLAGIVVYYCITFYVLLYIKNLFGIRVFKITSTYKIIDYK